MDALTAANIVLGFLCIVFSFVNFRLKLPGWKFWILFLPIIGAGSITVGILRIVYL